MAFEFKWGFSFSDGKKIYGQGDFIKSHEDTVDGAFVAMMGKYFMDALQKTVGNKDDLAKFIDQWGVKESKPFEVFPPEEEKVKPKKKDN